MTPIQSVDFGPGSVAPAAEVSSRRGRAEKVVGEFQEEKQDRKTLQQS
jgi:hypothetical protein